LGGSSDPGAYALRMTRGHAAWAAFVAAICVAARASADASARLVFIRDEAAAACPDETALRRAVEARLGYDPFLPWGGATLVVRFERDTHGFTANVEMAAAGASRGARTLRSDDPSCGGLVDATALAVSIALDTLRPPAPRPSEAEASTSPDLPSAPAPSPTPSALLAEAPPQVPAGSSTPPKPVVGLDAQSSVGTAPFVAAGISAWGRLQAGRASVGLEARVDLPSSSDEPGGSVSSWLVAGGLAPCFHLGPTFACAVGQLGSLQAAGGGVQHPKSGSDFFAAVGPRVGLEIPLTARLSVRLRADALVNLYRASVDLNGTPAWTASAVSGTFGAGVAVRFP
jgi:hypothetical protein